MSAETCAAALHISIKAAVRTLLHGCCLICVFFPGADPPAGILSRTFRVIRTLPRQINVHAAVLQKVCAFIASAQTPRRLVRNIATMCSVSARAARSAVSAMAAALPGSNAKWPPPLAGTENC